MNELNTIKDLGKDFGRDLGDDSSKLWVPQWLTTIVSLIGELVLLTVTVGIIMAMWLPAYLTSRPADRRLPEPAHDGPIGASPHAR